MKAKSAPGQCVDVSFSLIQAQDFNAEAMLSNNFGHGDDHPHRDAMADAQSWAAFGLGRIAKRQHRAEQLEKPSSSLRQKAGKWKHSVPNRGKNRLPETAI